MIATLLLGLAFVVLLVIEWRYRLRSVRLTTAFIALVVWVYAQPNITRAARRALDMPVAERVDVISGNPLSEFEVGLRTMEKAASDDALMLLTERLLSVGVLLWLSCSPVLRRAPVPSAGGKPDGNLQDQG